MSQQIKIHLLQEMLGWNLLIIDEDKWNNLSDEAKRSFMNMHIQFEDVSD